MVFGNHWFSTISVERGVCETRLKLMKFLVPTEPLSSTYMIVNTSQHEERL